ncbi:peptidoglycan DD-metalloendopeptidase family protein [Microbacterium sp. AZCO]|uniref:peptidoglycan DD-metalloendopeptidase family protein n=1 Tax=Microbacterium sp. AZCO TaxID=3142976 RepID=UPI0031F46F5B
MWTAPPAAEPTVAPAHEASAVVESMVVAEAEPLVEAGPLIEAESRTEQGASAVEASLPAPAPSATEGLSSRPGRRVRSAPRPITPEDAESVVPAAAIAWAAAAAAAAVEPQPLVPVEPVLTPAEPFELLEVAPEEIVAPEAEPALSNAEQPEASDIDEFERAARLFSFTGETPIQNSADEPEAEEASAPASSPTADEPVAHVAPRRRRVGRQLATASFSVGVMGIVGLITVGMTTPADAVAAVSGDTTSLVAFQGTDVAVDPEDIQAYVAPGDIQTDALDRTENYTTVSMGEIAAEDGITNYSDFYVNDPNAAIQWPFAVGVPITFGFGMRSGRMHEGADFVPGQGADIQAIAAGTVRTATSSGGGYGVEVVIDHIIDGQLVSSRYAHMLAGSIQVTEGQHVEAGTVLGHTGNTGHSFGAHTHFEILQNGTTAIDPIAWLRSHAGRESLDHE